MLPTYYHLLLGFQETTIDSMDSISLPQTITPCYRGLRRKNSYVTWSKPWFLLHIWDVCRSFFAPQILGAALNDFNGGNFLQELKNKKSGKKKQNVIIFYHDLNANDCGNVVWWLELFFSSNFPWSIPNQFWHYVSSSCLHWVNLTWNLCSTWAARVVAIIFPNMFQGGEHAFSLRKCKNS